MLLLRALPLQALPLQALLLRALRLQALPFLARMFLHHWRATDILCIEINNIQLDMDPKLLHASEQTMLRSASTRRLGRKAGGVKRSGMVHLDPKHFPNPN